MKKITIELSDETHKELSRLADTQPSQAQLIAVLEVLRAMFSAVRSEGSGWHPDDPEAAFLEEMQE